MTASEKEEHIKKINQETAKIPWKELEVHFARGALVKVSPSLDLVKTAYEFTQNNEAQVQAWMSEELVKRFDVEDAQGYQDDDELWAVVIAPWVLVQDVKAS